MNSRRTDRSKLSLRAEALQQFQVQLQQVATPSRSEQREQNAVSPPDTPAPGAGSADVEMLNVGTPCATPNTPVDTQMTVPGVVVVDSASQALTPTQREATQASVATGSTARAVLASLPPIPHSLVTPQRSEHAVPPDAGTPASVSSSNGTVQGQPVIPQSEPEPFQKGLDFEAEIPDIRDALAPRYHAGEPQLTESAIRGRARRIFEKRADGSKKVSEEVWNDWKSRGPAQRLLKEIFKRCGYDPDAFLISRLKRYKLLICWLPKTFREASLL